MTTMLKGLRWRLTLLYLLTALAFIVLLSVGTYRLLNNYFQRTTDLALQHKMAHEFRLFGAPVPPELVVTDQDTYSVHAAGVAVEDTKEAYNSEFSAIFVLPLNTNGDLVYNPNPFTPLIVPDKEAVAVALIQGYDWRTTTLGDGTQVRLLTYRLTRDDGPAVLQLGRDLIDQEHVLNQLLVIFLALGGSSAVMLGFASWWLAGRSLGPAQRAWERQQTFVANASHELRTPLALIRASAEAIQRRMQPIESRPQRLLDDIVGECDHMTRLVNDMLLLSRLDTGRLQLERVAITLPDLFDDLQRQLGHLADAQQIQLTMTDGHAGTVWGDPARLRQVLLIVLDNALQHTPPGGVVRITTQRHTQQVSISIADTGCGIPPEHLPHVFERFYRVDSSRTNGSNGTGLGLSIAKALVEAQQGTIAVTSRVDTGTQVTLTLPVVAT